MIYKCMPLSERMDSAEPVPMSFSLLYSLEGPRTRSHDRGRVCGAWSLVAHEPKIQLWKQLG